MTMFEDIIYIFRAFVILVCGILVLTYGCAYIDGELYKRSIEEQQKRPKQLKRAN